MSITFNNVRQDIADACSTLRYLFKNENHNIFGNMIRDYVKKRKDLKYFDDRYGGDDDHYAYITNIPVIFKDNAKSLFEIFVNFNAISKLTETQYNTFIKCIEYIFKIPAGETIKSKYENDVKKKFATLDSAGAGAGVAPRTVMTTAAGAGAGAGVAPYTMTAAGAGASAGAAPHTATTTAGAGAGVAPYTATTTAGAGAGSTDVDTCVASYLGNPYAVLYF